MIQAKRVQINHQFSPTGISPEGIGIRWVVEGALRQTASQVSLFDGSTLLLDSGRLESSAMRCCIR